MPGIRYLTALPVYNEQAHLLAVLRQVLRFSENVLVVDDGSTDLTPYLLTETESIQVIRHETNLGYGAALRTAFEYTIAQGYDALVTIDCDGQHQPQLIPELVGAVFPEGSAPLDIISGSRYLKTFEADSRPPEDRRQINLRITQQLNECLGLKLTDTFCGFKAYARTALEKLHITELGYAMPLQLWIQAVRHQMRIEEFPVPLIYLEEERSFGGSLDDARRRMDYYQEVLRREMESQSVECGSSSAGNTANA